MTKKTLFALAGFLFSTQIFAQDISGLWHSIDDKTGTSKAILEIRKDKNNAFIAKIIKITPRPGYTPKETCVNCPAPYTNKPILGLDVLTGLQFDRQNQYKGDKILDPLTGKVYSMSAKLSPNGKRYKCVDILVYLLLDVVKRGFVLNNHFTYEIKKPHHVAFLLILLLRVMKI